MPAMTRLTPNSAAERCGQSRATILRAIAAQSLPAVKQGGQWSIDAEALDLWASQRPQRARRTPREGQSGAKGVKTAPEAQNGPVSATEAPSEVSALTARLETLEALYGALRAEMDALRGQVSIQPPATPPEAPKDAPEGATPAKRRLWPFSAKS